MHRTTARGALLLTLLTALSLAAVSTSSALNDPDPPDTGGPSTMIFPVVGAARYIDDYGDPRGQGRHAGNDILTTWRSPAVAAEDGTIKFWTTSARAGCMLYLYGASGTTYLYIHLNNDLTAKRDNKGKCVPGRAYADRAEERRARQGRAADRLQRRLRRRRGDLSPPLRGAPEGRRRRRSVPVPEQRHAPALRAPDQGRQAGDASGMRGMPVSAGGGRARALGDVGSGLARRSVDDRSRALGRAHGAPGRAARPVGRRADRGADAARS